MSWFWRLPFATLLVAIVAIDLSGCSAYVVAVGIDADRVDLIEVGSTRAEVEDLTNAIEHEEACTGGSRVFYVYDRGQSPEDPDHPVAMPVAQVLVSLLSLGVPELYYRCAVDCQKGLLEIVYDQQGHVVAGFPHPYAYDAGWSCGGVRRPGNVHVCDRPRLEEGRWPPSFCACVRRGADVTDRARKIGGSEASVSATGCGRGPPGTTTTG